MAENRAPELFYGQQAVSPCGLSRLNKDVLFRNTGFVETDFFEFGLKKSFLSFANLL